MNIPKHVLDNFMTPLLAVFGEPSSPDPERFLSEYARHLKGYGSVELEKAADHVARTHKGPSRWPKLADCIEACNDAREALSQSAKPKFSGAESFVQEANAAERRMHASAIGHEAAQEGWVNGLREFVMAHKRWPREYEIEDMKRNAQFIDRCASGLENMGLLHGPLLGLANDLVERRQQIADRVITGEFRDNEKL